MLGIALQNEEYSASFLCSGSCFCGYNTCDVSFWSLCVTCVTLLLSVDLAHSEKWLTTAPYGLYHCFSMISIVNMPHSIKIGWLLFTLLSLQIISSMRDKLSSFHLWCSCQQWKFCRPDFASALSLLYCGWGTVLSLIVTCSLTFCS